MEGPYEILIIDDNVGFAENLKDILAEHQYAVSIAEDGKSAMKIASQREFDLVLMDINLPDIFGLDLVERMSVKSPKQEYIIITGHGTLETAIEAVKKKKIVSFEMKPLDIHHLLSLINQVKERKNAAEALRMSEQRYRLLVNSAPQPIFTVSREGVYKFMNSFAASLLGGTQEKLIGTTIPDHFKKEHAREHVRQIRESLETGPRSSIICLELLSGRQYWFSSHLQPIEMEGDSGQGCLVILYDITERKLAEVKTQQRLEAEKISSLISERFVGISDFDHAVEDTLRDIGLYSDAKRTFLIIRNDLLKNTRSSYEWFSDELTVRNLKKRKSILQYEKLIKEFASGQDLIITDVEKIPDHEEGLKNALLSMGIKSLFLLPIFAKGSLIGYWGMDNFGNPGEWTVEKFNLLVVISNIFSSAFHRRCVEQELSASEEIHRILLNASREGIAIMDRKGKIIEASDSTLSLLGFSKKEEIVGRTYISLIPKPLHKLVRDIFAKTLENGITQNVELEFIRNDDTIFNAEVSTTLIPEIDGEARGFISAIRDITHRKKMEKQLVHTERMAGIGEMAAGIAHEINQPLNTISLTLDNLLFSLKNNEMDKEYLETKSFKLFQNISRMRNIIDHVRTFSRQNDDYILGNFNVNDSIRNAVSMVSEQFKHKGINLVLTLDEEIKTPIGNTYKFEQVILNMIINAKDAIEEKRKHLQKDFNKTIEIVSFADSKNIFVEVRDNGIGIDPDKIDKVFLPFYTSKETGTGTGLGLSISFGIIKDMQGNIEVQSKINKGTTIRITVPVDVKRKGNQPQEKPAASKQ